ncbi:phosphoribosylamine--glycine ligase [Terriglobus albidus]|uniref:phosphoribosylamine--glycine ligase n=1 Tax=Terriglobus albidus TaxID=1592106 RepID=UPI0021E08875|nr:phosphoribosylamine--glycine ligase [Terriglobus albidus]
MKVLVIGGGGREHALVWSLQQSPKVSEVVCAPGNGGIAAIARCLPADVKDIPSMLAVVEQEQPGMTVIGPEVPLAAGIVDAMQQRGLRVFGPTQAAAQLESSKAFAKEFMQRRRIPTAHYAVCASLEEVRKSLPIFHTPLVVKADGLAAGKGVVICQTKAEAEEVAAGIFSGSLLGSSDTRLVLEEFLEGEEVSFFALCDGAHAIPIAAAQDHKRVGEGDTGLNTGGMGAYCTDALLEPTMVDWLTTHVTQNVVDGMALEGTPFTGILFCGLMMTARGPMVLEFNTRWGDPETEAIVLRLETDLFDLFDSAIDGRANEIAVRLKPGASACVIAASGGYPGSYRSGLKIDGLTPTSDTGAVQVFHAGTSLMDREFRTAGGRVLAVSAAADDLKTALAMVYGRLESIQFEGMFYRRDIGHRALAKEG